MTSPSPVACHEAGHAVVALALGNVVRSVRISDDGYGVARVRHRSPRHRAIIAMAGPCAERMVHGSVAGCDLDVARVADRPDRDAVARRAAQLVARHRHRIEHVARALDRHGSLSGDDVKRLTKEVPMIVTSKDGRQRHEDDDYVLKDGEGMRTPLYMLDSTQRAIRAAMPPVPSMDARREGRAVRSDALQEQRWAAEDRRRTLLSEAWRSPSSPTAAPRPKLTGDAATDRRRQYEARCKFLEDEWKR